MQVSSSQTVPVAASPSLLTTKGWSLDGLLASGPRFKRVPRISATSGLNELFLKIVEHENKGIPLIIEGWQDRPEWPQNLFDLDWLKETHGSQVIEARNVHGNRRDQKMPLSELADLLRAAPPFATPDETSRLYGKDMECPPEWHEWLTTHFALDALRPRGSADVMHSTVQTLMCYLGISDTFTPCHKDLCGSTGQNLMCYTENGGSAFWFMTAGEAAPDMSAYLRAMNQELDWETYVITVEQFASAPFDVYVAEQKLGDLVVVPPRSCHQVVNHGGVTIKTSWSRMTIRGLEMALYHELPIYRRVCRPEVYRIKLTIHDTLIQRTKSIREGLGLRASTSDAPPPQLASETITRVQGLSADLRKLLSLFDEVLLQEYSRDHEDIPDVSIRSPNERRTCDFCAADIFHSFFSCVPCGTQGEPPDLSEGLLICSGCYVEGRTCGCGEMQPVQCGSFTELWNMRNHAANTIRWAHTLGIVDYDAEDVDKTFYRTSDIAVFDAACLLHKMRDESHSKNRRACTSRVKGFGSHPIAYDWSLACKGCHSNKCFEHIIFSHSIHSAEAILEHSLDKTHEVWHKYHGSRKAEYDTSLPDLVQAIKDCSPFSLRERLTYAVLNCSKPRPYNDNVSYGYYDGPPIYPLSEHRPRVSSAAASGSDEGPETSISTSTRRKAKTVDREVMDYVMIPSRTRSKKRARSPGRRDSNKRQKLVEERISPETKSDPLFVPSGSPSSEEIEIDNEPGPSRKPSKRLPRRASLSSDDERPLASVITPATKPKFGPRLAAAKIKTPSTPVPPHFNRSAGTKPKIDLKNLSAPSRLDNGAAAEGIRDTRQPVTVDPTWQDDIIKRLSSLEADRDAKSDKKYRASLERRIAVQDHRIASLEREIQEFCAIAQKWEDRFTELKSALLELQKNSNNPEYEAQKVDKSGWWRSKADKQATEIQRYLNDQLMKAHQRMEQCVKAAVKEAVDAALKQQLQRDVAATSIVNPPEATGAVVRARPVMALPSATPRTRRPSPPPPAREAPSSGPFYSVQIQDSGNRNGNRNYMTEDYYPTGPQGPVRSSQSRLSNEVRNEYYQDHRQEAPRTRPIEQATHNQPPHSHYPYHHPRPTQPQPHAGHSRRRSGGERDDFRPTRWGQVEAVDIQTSHIDRARARDSRYHAPLETVEESSRRSLMERANTSPRPSDFVSDQGPSFEYPQNQFDDGHMSRTDSPMTPPRYM